MACSVLWLVPVPVRLASVDFRQVAAVDFVRTDVLDQEVNNRMPLATAARIDQLVAFNAPHDALDRIECSMKPAAGKMNHHAIDVQRPAAMQNGRSGEIAEAGAFDKLVKDAALVSGHEIERVPIEMRESSIDTLQVAQRQRMAGGFFSTVVCDGERVPLRADRASFPRTFVGTHFLGDGWRRGTPGWKAGKAADMRLLELMADHTDVTLETRREDPCLQGALLTFRSGRRLIIVERTYREGVVAILDPTEEEIATFRRDDLWKIWNSEKGVDLAVV